MSLWRWFRGLDDSREHRELRARGEALGYALPRNMVETAADVPRVLARKRMAVTWRLPTGHERERYGAMIELFADSLDAVVTPGGETWVMGERLFSGYPDPAAYAVVFLDRDGRVIAAAEVDRLPRGWTVPDVPVPPGGGGEGPTLPPPASSAQAR